MVDYYQA